MSDIMRPMSFGHLMNWILEEYQKSGSIFGAAAMMDGMIERGFNACEAFQPAGPADF